MNDISLAISPLAAAIIGFAVIAVIKLVDDAFNKDWRTVIKIVGAAIVGAGLAVLIPDVTVLAGLVTGLSASGLVTTANFLSPTMKVTNTSVVPDGEAV